MEGAEVGNFENDLATPSRMDGRGRKVNDNARAGLGTLAVHEADQARVSLGRADTLLRLPEQEPLRLDKMISDPRR